MKPSPFTSDTCAKEDVERGAEVTFSTARQLLGPLKFRQERQGRWWNFGFRQTDGQIDTTSILCAFFVLKTKFGIKESRSWCYRWGFRFYLTCHFLNFLWEINSKITKLWVSSKNEIHFNIEKFKAWHIHNFMLCSYGKFWCQTWILMSNIAYHRNSCFHIFA